MATRKFPAEIEVDDERGVIYVHFTRESALAHFQCHTAIRIKVGADEKFPLDLMTKAAERGYAILTR